MGMGMRGLGIVEYLLTIMVFFSTKSRKNTKPSEQADDENELCKPEEKKAVCGTAV